MHFSLYIDNIADRLEMQINAYTKEQGNFEKLFDILKEQKQGLLELKKEFGSVITPDNIKS